MSFDQLNLIEPILNALKSEGYTEPTPIQAQTIPLTLQGRDILGCAQTGTGKTAAFAIPILQLLTQNNSNQHPRQIKTLIVTPTRELAIQIGESFSAYGKNLKLKHAVIFGGVPQSKQVNQIKSGIDILIATPGRLLDLVDQKIIRLSNLEIFVLDEADRMLDMGFIHDIRKILKIIPAKRQSLFFSATMPEDIATLSSTILSNPAKVAVTPVSTTAETIQQYVYFTDTEKKKDLLIDLLQDKSIITALVFTRTKHGADKVVKFLAKANIKAEAIHGNKSQNARQRALSNFKDHSTRVLVATDIAARGIDIDELAFVVNYEIPNIPETYVHRIGRTGRAGSNGKAVSFCDKDEAAYLRDIQKLIGLTIPVIEDHDYPSSEKISVKEAIKPKIVQQQRTPRNNNNSFGRKPKQGNKKSGFRIEKKS